MITIPSLNNVTDILDTDMIMVTQQSGQSYKISGSELNKRGKIIIANGTTITGAPLKAGSSVRVYFTVDLTAANASTTLQLNYNNVNYYVKAPKDGTLINFVATNLGGSPAVFKYLQKYTTLELLFDGTQFVIIGNPVILSSADYTIYADGKEKNEFKYEVLITPYNGATETQVTLLRNISDYKFLLFVIRWGESSFLYDSIILPTDLFERVGRQVIVENMDGARARFRYVSDTEIKVHMQNGVNASYCELFGIVI